MARKKYDVFSFLNAKVCVSVLNHEVFIIWLLL